MPRLFVLAAAAALFPHDGAAVPSPAVFGSPWYPNRHATNLTVDAHAAALTWGHPSHPDTVVTYLPLALPLDVDGAFAGVELTWESDGTDDCPARDWADHGFCKNDEPCMHTSVHCLAGTGDFRIGLLDSNGAGRVDGAGWAETTSYSGVDKALSSKPFSGYLGYSFRISPHVSTEATEYVPKVSKSSAVPCSFNWNGLEHAGHTLSKERLAKTGCFEVPTGTAVQMRLEIKRESSTEARLLMRMSNVTYTYRHHIRGGKEEEERFPQKIDTILIEYPNGRRYSYVRLSPAVVAVADMAQEGAPGL